MKNPKVYSLTGHGIIRRKKLADDGKSLRSQKSFSDDPFAERPSSSPINRTPTSFETRLKEDISINQTQEIIPDLPSRAQHPDELPQPRLKKSRPSTVVYDADFDALFSSSPLAQSTPRIRLNPTFQDGRATLKNVPADTPSFFDPETSSVSRYSDMDIDIPFVATNHDLMGLDVKKKTSQTKNVGLATKSRDGKRMKKHPSPSKAELEVLESAMPDFPEQMSRSQTFNNLNSLSAMGYESTLPHGVLTSRDSNTKLPIPKPCEKGKGFGKYLKPDLTRTAGTMPELSKSKIPRLSDGASAKVRLEARQERRFMTRDPRDDINGGDLMDIDELQWDRTALMRRR